MGRARGLSMGAAQANSARRDRSRDTWRPPLIGPRPGIPSVSGRVPLRARRLAGIVEKGAQAPRQRTFPAVVDESGSEPVPRFPPPLAESFFHLGP